MTIDKFTQKLNINEEYYVIQDEELVITDGVFEGELKHDNIKNDSVMIYTGQGMTGG